MVQLYSVVLTFHYYYVYYINSFNCLILTAYIISTRYYIKYSILFTRMTLVVLKL